MITEHRYVYLLTGERPHSGRSFDCGRRTAMFSGHGQALFQGGEEKLVETESGVGGVPAGAVEEAVREFDGEAHIGIVRQSDRRCVDAEWAPQVSNESASTTEASARSGRPSPLPR